MAAVCAGEGPFAARSRKMLLVGWDAADWKIIQPLLDRHELPVLERVIDGGVMGNLSSIQPMLSPMLWNSIATGKRPYRHGIHGFTEVDRESGRPVPVSSSSRRCQALWNILNREGLRTHVVGWLGSHPAEAVRGVCVSERFGSPAPDPGQNWPLAHGTVFPEEQAGALAELRVRPEEIPGETLSLFVPNAARVNQRADKRLHLLAIRLAECFSIHAAATHLIEHEPWDFAAVYYRAIDWICHDFMVFHPPKMAGVYDAEFDLYRDVVNSAYRLHDLMLGRLLQLAGENTTLVLVSDHGFHSDRLRPAVTPNVPAGIAAWHRTSGILAMRGPGLRRDELVHGASLLDITPTILALYDLPVGGDMDGRVMAEAFAEPPEIQVTETWETGETVAKSAPRHPEDWSILRQFVELGYIQEPGSAEEAVRGTERENNWNLARSYMDAGCFADALPLLEGIYGEWPERWDYCFHLARCQALLGLREEALETAGGFPDSSPACDLLLAHIAHGRGDLSGCMKHLASAEATGLESAELQDHIGLMHIGLRQWIPAETAYRKAQELNPDDPYAHLGLAHCHLRAGRFQETADEALRALGLRFDLPMGHYHLGVALARMGELPRAIQALETCLRYQPASAPAHRYLAALYAHQPDSEAKVAEHRRYLNGRGRSREEAALELAKLREEIAERARLRFEMRAHRRAEASKGSDPGAPSEPLEFLLVSGLPRSGTSLMMQMLAAAGLDIMSDGLRPPDASNPRGYFEWQEVKRLPSNPRIIEKARGRVVKVISMLLPSLPSKHRYRILFMARPIEEVAASQEKMRAALPQWMPAPREILIEQLRQHRERIIELLGTTPNVDLFEVDYPMLLRNPRKIVRDIAEFAHLGETAIDPMIAAIDPTLGHNTEHLASVAGVWSRSQPGIA